MGPIAVSLKKQIEKMAEFSNKDCIGTTRLPFTKAAKDAEEYITQMMREAGLKVRTDETGAVIGRLDGKREETFIMASHYDTVENGGNYDGVAGILCGIKIAEMLTKYKNREYSLEIIATNDEEGARFSGGFLTSKAMLGEWTIEELKKQKDKDSVSIYEAMTEYGLKPEEIHKAKRNINKIKGFFEIHIEQGPILDKAGLDMGFVDTIVGMERMIITVWGRTDHAGTTPMDMRKDAVEMAAKVIARIGDCARKYPETVATTGYISVSPNAVNTIADRVEFSLDIRSSNKVYIENVIFEIKNLLAKYTVYSLQETLSIEPVEMNKEYRKILEKAADKRKFSWKEINSGAGHDSLPIGRVIDTAMIFVPSIGGRSHCPEEYTEAESLEKAVWVLYDVMKEILKCKEE